MQSPKLIRFKGAVYVRAEGATNNAERRMALADKIVSDLLAKLKAFNWQSVDKDSMFSWYGSDWEYNEHDVGHRTIRGYLERLDPAGKPARVSGDYFVPELVNKISSIARDVLQSARGVNVQVKQTEYTKMYVLSGEGKGLLLYVPKGASKHGVVEIELWMQEA